MHEHNAMTGLDMRQKSYNVLKVHVSTVLRTVTHTDDKVVTDRAQGRRFLT